MKPSMPLTPLAAGLLLAFNAMAQDHSQHQMPVPAAAQSQDHSQHQMPALAAQDHSQPPAKTKAKPQPNPTSKPKPKEPPSPAAQTVDHAAMGHGESTAQPTEQIDHSAMGHGVPEPQPTEHDHAPMGQDAPTPPPEELVDHSAMGHQILGSADEPITPIPEITDADRVAAVRPPNDHPVHDNTIQSFVLFNRLEAFDAEAGTGVEWEGQAWFGTDLNKIWLRSEGERSGGHTETAGVEVLYGRAIAPWWDVVAGVRHDFKPGDSRDFAAIGIIGLAPYKFEVEATAYIGESGQTAARLEVEYETLLTNRLILQPLVEVNLYGQNDEQRGIGSGLSTAEFGLRLRYEIRREFAPYVGVVHERAFGRTADFRRNEREDVNDTRLVAGIRIWF